MEDQNEITSPDPLVSRFTAVNSKKDQKTNVETSIETEANSNGYQSSRRGSVEKSSSQMRLSSRDHGSLTKVSNPMNRKEDRVTASTNGERITYQSSHPQFGTEAPHKRRRSSSISNNPYHSIRAPNSFSKHDPVVGPVDADFAREEPLRQQLDVESLEKYHSDIQYKQYLNSEAHELGQQSEAWSLRQLHRRSSFTSDEQIGHVLQRASQNLDAQGHKPDITLCGKSNQGSNPGPRFEVKKRKRNFSNRTKTGCMTCRRRKKKCDETRPKCNNCLRGGFTCAGYQSRGSNQKEDKKFVPLPLQSKTVYKSSPYALVDSCQSTSIARFQQREPLPDCRGQSLRVDLRQDCHPGVEGHEPIVNDSSNTQTPTPVTASSSAHPDQIFNRSHDRVIPLIDLSRQESRIDDDKEKLKLAAPSPMPPILHPDLPGATTYSNPQMAAQLALSNLASANGSYLHGEQNQIERPPQKEEILADRLYFPLEKELVRERERCKAACWRFNSSANPNIGVSPDERARLFRDIVFPRSVGDNFVVDTPFSCDYGYNISIGQDVVIGKNCTILDTCEVRIGDRCYIGPNVDIYAASSSVDPNVRLGAKGPQLGQKVNIESDCWIGGRALILPGLTIGRGAIVAAGSVVTKDVPPYTIVRGNPANILRAISTSESSSDLLIGLHP